MTYKDFRRLLLAAPACDTMQAFIEEDALEEDRKLLEAVYAAAHDGLTIRTIADTAGMSMRQLAIRYGLPYRTVQDWAAGLRTPPMWQLPLIAYAVLSDYMGE